MTDAENAVDGMGSSAGLDGQRVVFVLYLLLVGVAVLLGAILGVILEDVQSVALFGLLEMPPTPAGLALYGGVTVGVLLGVPLLGVRYVSRREDA